MTYQQLTVRVTDVVMVTYSTEYSHVMTYQRFTVHDTGATV